MGSPTKAARRPAPAAATRRGKRAPKPQGRRLIDDREPLNDDGRIRREDAGFVVKQRVIGAYSKQGFDSVLAGSLTPRFRWVGLYTQHKQGLSGEYTGVRTNAGLQDRYFILRIRLDGGQTTTKGIRTIDEISRDFARDTADFSNRQNIQPY